MLHWAQSPSPRFRQQPPPYSWKSTINHVSSKPDTSSCPAHPHGDHYESLQARVLWPKQATQEIVYILFYPIWIKCRSPVGHSSNASQFSQRIHCFVFIWVNNLGSNRQKTDIVVMTCHVLQPRCPLFCELWRQHSSQSGVSDTVALFWSRHISFTAA